MNAALAVGGGLVVLIGGAELLVRGASRIAARLAIAPIVIGLTIVSLGTSAPELAIGIDAALTGSAALAVGNIVGTNIVNLLLILGGSAAIRSIALGIQTLRTDLPVIAFAAVLLLVLARDGQLSTLDGTILILFGFGYTAAIVRLGRHEPATVQAEFDHEFAPPPEEKSAARLVRDFALLVGGLAIVVVGAEVLVGGAVDLARAFGVSEAVIGLTIIAIGTSAPELVTTLISTVRGDRDVALGNLLGSSVYNIALILGITALVAPGGIEVPPEVLRVDLPVMTAVALACVPVFVTGRKVSRFEGAVFVGCYALYLTYLLIART
ncbi:MULTISPECIES: calcium/sodium antiporter [unclassified Rhodococcus (in: high G+C Gram-positive bacteria)]|uniref:calcium/sodium antiporter n=1 Tax=unclassified Rhodococcus (in: high G+C Gram-positive bacteria) TaxID=192944 RepID=UPI0016398BE9|nr:MULTISPECIES: calcium/sodium antiporter [unclassified Rhodococcus (in: high G+C Gram-positive bacteria)]MBC2644423.1 calcium/sodium antiporter [Rhodococcus sp. 3A]MBC2897885.1 calcium/sodium antiporter [Rhodococcus sp. 4CII]